MASPPKVPNGGDWLPPIYSYIGERMGELESIWKELGLVTKQEATRRQAVHDHITELCEAMLEDERNLLIEVKQRIDENRAQIEVLVQDLGLTGYQEPEATGLYQLDHRLSLACEDLRSTRDQRLLLFKEAAKEEKDLCVELEEECIADESEENDNIPSAETIEKIKSHTRELSRIKKSRQVEFCNFKERILSIMDELDYAPDDTFTRDIVFEDEDSFKMSARNIKTTKEYFENVKQFHEKRKLEVDSLREKVDDLYSRLDVPDEEREIFYATLQGVKLNTVEKLKEELARLQALKMQHMERFIKKIRTELADWWAKCFYSEGQKEEFAAYYDNDYTEALLELHELEMNRLKRYYESRKQYLEYVDEWNQLYTQHKFLQQRSKDPNRYKNRGAGMLEEEKERRRVEKKLPKLEIQIKERFAQYEHDNGAPLLIEGVRLPEYIQLLHEREDQAKENEKLKRQRARRQETATEMAFGSSNLKRKLAGTPSKDNKRMALRFQLDSNATRSPQRNTIYDPLTPGKSTVGMSSMAAPRGTLMAPRGTLMAPRNTLGIQKPAPLSAPSNAGIKRTQSQKYVSRPGAGGIASRTRRRALCSQQESGVPSVGGGRNRCGGRVGGGPVPRGTIGGAQGCHEQTGILSHLHDMPPFPGHTSDPEFSVAANYTDFAMAVNELNGQHVLTSTMHLHK